MDDNFIFGCIPCLSSDTWRLLCFCRRKHILRDVKHEKMEQNVLSELKESKPLHFH